MSEYHKIQTIYKRDPATNMILVGDYSRPEFEYLANNQWVWTEKVDGTNVRVTWDGETVRFGGRTDNASMPTFLVNKLTEMFPRELFAREFGDMFVMLYGEGYGAKIQKGGGNYIPNGCSFILFDVSIGGMWLERSNVLDIAIKLGCHAVPMIGQGTLHQAIDIVSRGLKSCVAETADVCAEGLVVRPVVELNTRRGERVIAKIKTRDFA